MQLFASLLVLSVLSFYESLIIIQFHSNEVSNVDNLSNFPLIHGRFELHDTSYGYNPMDKQAATHLLGRWHLLLIKSRTLFWSTFAWYVWHIPKCSAFRKVVLFREPTSQLPSERQTSAPVGMLVCVEGVFRFSSHFAKHPIESTWKVVVFRSEKKH